MTWNINSLKVRYGLLMCIISKYTPNVILLQEIKMSDKHTIPSIEGYHTYLSLHETIGYAGVAIISKNPMKVIFNYKSRVLICYDEINNLYFSTVYMYNGFSERAPVSKKMELYRTLINEFSKFNNLIVGGDWNICMNHECTVINPYSDTEKGILMQMQSMLKPVINESVYRTHTNSYLKPYITWWDYRHNSYNRNKGMGLDKFLTNLAHKCTTQLLYEYRACENPSDHCPILMTIEY